MQKELVLGLDLDGTIADYQEGVKQYLYRHGWNEEIPYPDHYSLVESAGWPFKTDEEYIKTHMKAADEALYAALPVYDGAVECLNELSDRGVHIRIVTHRLFVHGQHAQTVSDTVRWLDANHIPYRSLCFTGLKDSIGADLYLEDNADNIKTLRDTGHKCMVVDQPYNKQVDGPRLYSWKDATDQIYEELEAGRAERIVHPKHAETIVSSSMSSDGYKQMTIEDLGL